MSDQRFDPWKKLGGIFSRQKEDTSKLEADKYLAQRLQLMLDSDDYKLCIEPVFNEVEAEARNVIRRDYEQIPNANGRLDAIDIIKAKFENIIKRGEKAVARLDKMKETK